MKRLVLLLAVVLFFACSHQKKLTRTYVGQPFSPTDLDFGRIKTVFEKENEKEYIFEKIEFLKSTEISQHKLTLDPMVTPQAKKTTLYYITVANDIITKIKTEEEYERRQ